MLDPPNKSTLKITINLAINAYWATQWAAEKESKPSIRYLTIPDRPLGEPHHIWSSVGTDPSLVKQTMVKARLLTGTYTLQANRAKFNQHTIPGTCPLCKSGIENREHFLMHYSSLIPIKQKQT